MVNVLHATSTKPIADEQAMEEFRHQWHVYSKLVDHDCFSHREVAATLHRRLQHIHRPFRFLDLACGDARTAMAAIRGAKVASYRGIDLSAPALDLARRTVESLPCPATLEQRDFVTAVRDPAERADVVWIGLSLHHLTTPDKAAFMRDVRALLPDDGEFIIFEPTCHPDEDRAAFLDRFERIVRPEWTALLAEPEWTSIITHVKTCDLPETPATWTRLGNEAGFTRVTELFRDPLDFFRMFAFQQ